MLDLQFTAEFWFGAVILCVYEAAKFNELSSVDAVVSQRFRFLPNLKARDFVGRLPFFLALLGFLVATLLVYGLLCGFSPTLIRGWAQVSGVPGDIEETIKSVPYPLYIVAVLMGIAHQSIPGLARISNIQRDYFHYWIGVPRKVVETSNNFVDQLLSEAQDREELGGIVKRLASNAWRSEIDDYADTLFYKAQIERLKLHEEAELQDVLNGSLRELRSLIEQLVDAAALATVKKSGGRALGNLANDLGVTMPQRTNRPARRFVVAALLYGMGLTVLWFVIPMAQPLLEWVLGKGMVDFWPTSLMFSGQFLLAQVVPIFIALTVALMMSSGNGRRSRKNDPETPTLLHLLDRYAIALLGAMFAVLVFDYVQGLYDFGFLNESYKGAFSMFLLDMLPFYVLHSAISLVICFIVLKHLGEIEDGPASGSLLKAVLSMIACVALISGFYAKARLIYQYDDIQALDYVALIVLLNVVGGSLALVAARQVSRHSRGRRSSMFLRSAAAH